MIDDEAAAKLGFQTHATRARTLTPARIEEHLAEYARLHGIRTPTRPTCEWAMKLQRGHCSWKNCVDCWAVTAWIVKHGEPPIPGHRNG